jgi:ribosomal protein L24
MGVFRKAFKDVMHQANYKILRGDKVMVTAGKDAGQVGTVLKVIRDPKFPRVVVEGLNLVGGQGLSRGELRPTGPGVAAAAGNLCCSALVATRWFAP